MKKDKSKKRSIMNEEFKLPTVVQFRKHIKQKEHLWSNKDRLVAPNVLLSEDVLILHSSTETLKETFGDDFDIKGRKDRARKRIEYLDDCIVRLKKSSFDYNFALMSPEDKDESGVPLIVTAEIRLAEDRKILLEFIKLIDKCKYKE